MVIGHNTGNPTSVLSSPQNAVEIWEILEDVITLFSPVAQGPVSHLGTLQQKEDGTFQRFYQWVKNTKIDFCWTYPSSQ